MIAKELRALLPIWAAVAGTMAASQLLRDLWFFNFSAAAYVIGAAALGAMSMGHEYSHRTMALTLTQPISRRRVLLTKLGVLAVLLLGLALLSTVAVSLGRGEPVAGAAVRWLPGIASLFVAPALTLATRSPVGGAVFTLGLGGLLLIAGEWFAILNYGHTVSVDSYRVSFVWGGLLAISTSAAAAMWWALPRLEVVDGRGEGVDFAPHGATATASLTRREPTWLLIGKELRLQQLAFAIAAIYVVTFVAVVIQTRAYFYSSEAAFMVSMLYAGLLALVIGSMATAEERNLGTIDAQLLLPMRASRQWVIKVSVALGLTLVLGILLPAALGAALQPERAAWGRNLPTVAGITVMALMALTTLSLYVSTLCSSGVWALVMSVPAAFAVGALVLQLAGILRGALDSFVRPPAWAAVNWTSALVTVAVIVVVQRLALANYRSADRSRSRIAAHVGIAATAAVAALTLVGVVGALSR